jgi:hypothetical protein
VVGWNEIVNGSIEAGQAADVLGWRPPLRKSQRFQMIQDLGEIVVGATFMLRPENTAAFATSKSNPSSRAIA